MRTKTLLLTAALSAAGIATSMAQGTVYSVNAVGYINLTVPKGFSIIANQLNTGGNTVEEVFANAPGGIVLYKYTGGQYTVNSKDPDLGWDDPTQTFKPGEAGFILNPAAGPATITFVGEVPQGPALTTQLPANFSLASSQVPQAGLLDTDLEYPSAPNDVVYLYRNGGYQIFANDPDLGWDPVEPSLNVGEGFFVKKAASGTWTRNFSVNTP